MVKGKFQVNTKLKNPYKTSLRHYTTRLRSKCYDHLQWLLVVVILQPSVRNITGSSLRSTLYTMFSIVTMSSANLPWCLFCLATTSSGQIPTIGSLRGGAQEPHLPAAAAVQTRWDNHDGGGVRPSSTCLYLSVVCPRWSCLRSYCIVSDQSNCIKTSGV